MGGDPALARCRQRRGGALRRWPNGTVREAGAGMARLFPGSCAIPHGRGPTHPHRRRCGAAVEQEVLRLERAALAAGGSHLASPARAALAHPECRLATPTRPCGDLDARWLGIPLLLPVGFDVPCGGFRQLRSGHREAAVHLVALPPLHRPQCPDARLRMGPLGCQSTDRRLGGDAHLPDRSSKRGGGGSGISADGPAQADPGVRLVGEPQRSLRRQRVRRRLPGAG